VKDILNYCSKCGAKLFFGSVPDDDRERHFCKSCGAIHYRNPNIIVGCIPRWEDKVLLCKRAIEPCLGKWTLPAGFHEIGESVEEGAARETLEEANARVEISRLYAVYNLPRLGQVYLIFLSDLVDLDFSPGRESLEVRLFKEKETPWDEIAFSAVTFALKEYFSSRPEDSGEVLMGTRHTHF